MRQIGSALLALALVLEAAASSGGLQSREGDTTRTDKRPGQKKKDDTTKTEKRPGQKRKDDTTKTEKRPGQKRKDDTTKTERSGKQVKNGMSDGNGSRQKAKVRSAPKKPKAKNRK